MLSSRDDEAGKVQALDSGADDYVTKPFGMDELLARMRAAIRHQLQTQGERPVFHVGDLSVDLVRRIVKVRDKEVKLSPKEYDLLRLSGAARRQGADAQIPARQVVESRPPMPSTCGSTSGNCGKRSRTIPNGRVISSPKRASVIVCSVPSERH